jgi:uncharacterized membrane protein
MTGGSYISDQERLRQILHFSKAQCSAMQNIEFGIIFSPRPMKLNSLLDSPKRSTSTSTSRLSREMAMSWLNTLTNLDSRRRIGLAVMLGMGVFLALPDVMHLNSRILAAWISGVLCFLGIVLLMMSHANQIKTHYRAQRQEAQHWTIFLLVVVMALTSIFAIALMLIDNGKDTPDLEMKVQIVLSVLAILSSWFLTHTMFALHYATCYYREDDLTSAGNFVGGISLPDENDQPDYLDFMYFSFTIGMTSQTSDISITSPSMRQLVLGHGIVSFFFYSIIIAASVGIVSGLM